MLDELNKTIKQHNEYILSKYVRTQSDFEGFYMFEVATEGASGGNCWNDDPAEDYYLDQPEVEQKMYEEIYYTFFNFAKESGFSNLDDATWKFIHGNYNNDIDSRNENEYYGNYTAYKLYSLKIDDFIQTLEHTKKPKP